MIAAPPVTQPPAVAAPPPAVPAPAAKPQPTVVVVAKPERPTGETLLRCKVSPLGEVGPCEVASEHPAGVGLGASAMRLATRFKVDPPRSGGRPTAGVVLLPFQFRMAGSEASAPPKP